MSIFTRTIKATASITLDAYTNLPITVNFEYSEDSAPTTINFYFNKVDGYIVSGSFNGTKINSYNVNGEVVESELLTALQTKLVDIYTNYKTV